MSPRARAGRAVAVERAAPEERRCRAAGERRRRAAVERRRGGESVVAVRAAAVEPVAPVERVVTVEGAGA
jgi:hypothetical protein